MTLRVAVVGCGSIGSRHLGNVLGMGSCEAIVFDSQPAVLEAIRRPELRVARTLEEVWAFQPSVAFVATPPALHVAQALEAARHGCHLFIEKPLSHSEEGIDALVSATEQANLVTMVACNMRFHPGPRTVKSLLEKKKIGDVLSARIETGSYLPRWRPRQDYRQSYSASVEQGGAILDCIHEIDLALWYFGAARVAGFSVRAATSIGLDTDGLAEILLDHPGGVLSSVHLNFVQRDYRRACQIVGTRGSIYWDFLGREVRCYGEDGGLAETLREPEGWTTNQMYVDEVAHFLDCVRGRRPTCNPIREGLQALRIALQIRRGKDGNSA